MIISASRRTDIPAFYPDWLMDRIKTGYCAVPNPFNRNQVSYISLKPDEVEAIVFWSRNPAPLMERLNELDQRGFNYYFQFTLVNNPKQIDPYSPSFEKAADVFRQLSMRIGKERVIWRYDPIFLSNLTGYQYHIEKYNRIAETLNDYTVRSVISFVDDYRKARKRIRNLEKSGVKIHPCENLRLGEIKDFVLELVKSATSNGMELQSCAGHLDMTPFGVKAGKCIDDDLVRTLFNYDYSSKKDPSQRKECGCAVSRDIGMYDSCLFGCAYCYATQSFERARKNNREHRPDSPSLLGWYDADPATKKEKKNTILTRQLKLFSAM
ncbi:DUF1848 domain-containing protein [Desulfogranum mediterraneum]|uniref:DUF1848 domain-containing protein n=1 Tax=Desulfogranum mediterraneum TaxID=160661 RepID=UPI0003F9FDD3|nr:DUF1848 domain-containing protein [Desulfogranum mediterraneum]